jgi:high-affinity iron transporter
VLLAAAFFVATMVYWMHLTAKSIKRHIEGRLESISAGQATSGLGVFLFVFLMVFREGAETVLMLSAVSLNTEDLLNFIGAAVGLALAVVFGVIFIRGTVRLDLRQFFRVTTVILIFVVVQLTITGMHELSEGGILPSSPTEMAIIGPIVSNEIFFVVAILALAALMVLFDWRSRQAAAPAVDKLSDAERRRELYRASREKLWTAAVLASTFLSIVVMTAEFVYAKSLTALSPATALTASGDVVRIPLDSVSDGDLHRFSYNSGGSYVRFIVVQTGGRYATALDACEICGSQGYYQSGPEIFCRNCGAAIYTPTIGVSGGCNPIPLHSEESGSDLVIKVSDLLPGAPRFAAAAHE